MTDEELIAQMSEPMCVMRTKDIKQLADRIEELEKACAEWAEVSQSDYQRAKAAEAKLAKAVEALEEIATDEHPLGWIAIAALAELKGQDDEWKCPINYTGCTKNCGSYGCGN